MNAYTLHVPFLADDDAHALERAAQMTQWLTDTNAGDDEKYGVTDDWDVSNAADWAEILDRPVTASDAGAR